MMRVRERLADHMSTSLYRVLACLSVVILCQAAPATAQVSVLQVQPGGPVSIDGDPTDWRLWEFQTYSRGGQLEAGDIGLIGWLDGVLYYGENQTQAGYELPDDATDHTGRMYSRHDASYQYFLFRLDDDDIQHPSDVGDNYRNDCVEFFVDPGNNDSTTPMWNTTNTSVFELVIDVVNQKNVYMTPSDYRTQLLAGVTSATAVDATGWWLEVQIDKSATNPPLPASGTFGIDIFFRDQDVADATLYGWTEDFDGVTPFPSKIPANWGDVANPVTTFLDCNENGTPDDQDISGGSIPDCNANSIPDDCDITYGLSGDCDVNEVPDECQNDTDLDGIIDLCDNCVDIPNASQENNDGDAPGDACDPDDDNDTITDEFDNCPFTANASQLDDDLDGAGNACDLCPDTLPGVLVDEVGCPVAIPGDFDGDGDVDLGDYGTFQACLTAGVPQTLPPQCAAMDFQGDGDVDPADFTIMVQCMTGSRVPGDPSCAQ